MKHASPHPLDPAEILVVGKVMRRLLPFMMTLAVLNYLNRVNIQFAKLEMEADLGLNDADYAFGAGVFFISYVLLEVPANLALERFGARAWIARITVAWGLVSAAMALIQGHLSFYTLRLMLGVAQAGFFPGMVLYLTYWAPAADRARTGACFLASTALAGVVGGPLAGAILQLDGWGMQGWRWLFLLEGAATVVAGFLAFRVLCDRPEQAQWLDPEERRRLVRLLDKERTDDKPPVHTWTRAMREPKVWMMGVLYGTIMFGYYGINYWTASIIQRMAEASTVKASLLTAIPYSAAVLAMVLVGRWSDAIGERRWMVGGCCAIGAAGMFLCSVAESPVATIAALSLAAAGIWGTLGPFWATPPTFLAGAAAAAGIAVINSVGNLGGGLFGPNVMAYLNDPSGGYMPGLLATAAVLAVAALLAPCCLQTRQRVEDTDSAKLCNENVT